MRFATISELKVNASNLDLSEGQITITQNGIPVYVTQSYADYKTQKALIESVKADLRRQNRAK